MSDEEIRIQAFEFALQLSHGMGSSSIDDFMALVARIAAFIVSGNTGSSET